MLGAKLGEYLGRLAGAAAQAWLAQHMNQANEAADEGPAATSDQAVTCPSCAVEIPCCNTPGKSNDPNVADELDRQLARQERAINDMTGDDVTRNMDKN